MSKKVCLIHSNPYDRDSKAYNVQEIGIGKAFCKLGYDFDYICFKKKNPKTEAFFEENGCVARWIEKPRIRFFRWGLNFEVCSKEFLEKYDIVICREYYQYMTFKAVMNHPNVIIYNGPYWNMFMIKPFSRIYDMLVTKKINNKVKKICTKSELSTSFLMKKGYTKIETVGVGLDIDRFDDNAEISEETVKIRNLMLKYDCLLYVGTVDRNKNYPFLLDVYKKLLVTYPDLKFVIIGKSKQDAFRKLLGKTNASYEKECNAKMSQNVLNGIIRCDRIENSQLKYIYPLCKAFLLPSKKEIFGMVMLEAMYFCAPVVTSINGGSTTLIKNQETGVMIAKFDTEIWVRKIKEMFENDDKREKNIANAKKLIVDDYNWDCIVKKMIDGIC